MSDSSSVASPCVRNCCLDQDDVCLGCGRHLDEIVRWGDAGNEEREQILARAKERRVKMKHTRFDK